MSLIPVEGGKVLGSGKLFPLGSLSDEGLGLILGEYKVGTAKRYRAVTSDELVRYARDGEGYGSTKLDGELWFLVKQGGETALVAPNGRVIAGTALVAEASGRIGAWKDGIVAGELVALPETGRPRVQHVARALGDDQEPKLRFHPFDLVRHDGADSQATPYGERWAVIDGAFKGASRCPPVVTFVGDAATAADHYREWTQGERAEGLVYRAPSGIVFKVKPTFTLDAVVVAFGARVSAEGTPELRELQVALMRDDGGFHLLGSVGGGLSLDDRSAWHRKLTALEVPSSFRLANRDGALCTFVRPEVVVEIKVSDLLTADSDDRANARMRLGYDPATGWIPEGLAPIPAMLFPILQRERPDKRVDVANVGLSQVTQRVAFEEAPAALAHRPDAEVIFRKVFVKGEAGVRKVVVLRAPDKRRAPFLVFTTDYSGGRAEPLQVGVKPASTEARALAMAEAWLGENIKKGWTEPGAEAPAPAEKPKKKAKKEE